MPISDDEVRRLAARGYMPLELAHELLALRQRQREFDGDVTPLVGVQAVPRRRMVQPPPLPGDVVQVTDLPLPDPMALGVDGEPKGQE